MATPGTSDAFVQLDDVFFDYTERLSVLARLLRQLPVRQSVVRSVTVALPHGSQSVVYGEEAAGKTTLLRLVAGLTKPTAGRIIVNGKAPQKLQDAAAGFVSEVEMLKEGLRTPDDVLQAYAQRAAHHTTPAADVREISERAELGKYLHRPLATLATSERLRVGMAKAALSAAPVILLDDIVELLGVVVAQQLLARLYKGRTVIIATRSTAAAQDLALPIMLLHKGSLQGYGTLEDLARQHACARAVNVWIEGLRYDLLRALRSHPGVRAVTVLSTAEFSGQKLRIEVQSTRYLPGVYDLISTAPVVQVEEELPKLENIIAHLYTRK